MRTSNKCGIRRPLRIAYPRRRHAHPVEARAELEKDRIVVSEIYPFITATNFGKNRMGSPAGGGPAANYADGDKPEFVASLILAAIEEGQAQYFANDRLRKMAGVGV